jgi:hypothetical protein
MFVLSMVFLVLLALTACQSIGGFDINKALIALDMPASYEANSTFVWNIDLKPRKSDDDTLSQLDYSRIAAVSKGKIDFSDIKLQDKNHFSIDSTVYVRDKQIPVSLYGSPEAVDIKVSGAQKLIHLPIGENESSTDAYSPLFSPYSSLFQGQNREAIKKQFVTTIITNLPNPKSISVEKISSSINNTTIPLSNVKLSFNGEEFPNLLIGFIDNLSSDEQNLKTLITLILKSSESENKDTTNELDVNKMFDEIKTSLLSLKDEIKDDKNLKLIETKDNKVSLEFGIDQDGNIRQSNFTLDFVMPENDYVNAFHISASNQYWDINKNVTAKARPSGAINFKEGEIRKAKDFIKQVDPNSDTYKFLKEDLKSNILEENFYALTSFNKKYAFGLPIIEDDNMMVGARYFSQNMGLDLSWDNDNQKITLTDGRNKLILKIGSKIANYNGSDIVLSKEPEVINNLSYIPLRSVAEAFGMTLSYNQKTNMVTVTSVDP